MKALLNVRFSSLQTSGSSMDETAIEEILSGIEGNLTCLRNYTGTGEFKISKKHLSPAFWHDGNNILVVKSRLPLWV